MSPKGAPAYGPLGRCEFRCEHCGGIYTSHRSEEEKLAEEMKNFGFNASDDDRVSLCDDCYNEFMADYHDHGLSGHAC